MEAIERLIAQIQEAPFAPELWPEVLLQAAQLTGGWSGQLFAAKDRQFILDIAGGYSDDLARELVRQGGVDPARSPRPRHVLGAPPLKILCDGDYAPAGKRDRWRIYRDFYERVDGHYNTAALLAHTGAHVIGIAINHSKGQGAPGPEKRASLERLLPHLRDAARSQLRLENHNALIALGALEALSIPAILSDGEGQIVRASALAEREFEGAHLIKSRNNKLSAVHPRSDKALQAALKQCAESPLTGQRSVLLASEDGRLLATASVAPIPSSVHAFRLGARVLVALPSRIKRDPAQHLAVLGLTAAESEVARLLFEGRSADEIAAARNTTRETVKTQIKSIYGKLSVSSRVELHEKLRMLF